MSFHFRPNDSFSRIIELTPTLRKEIEATVERLIGILDLFDGDENVEDDGNGEPWLGWPDGKHPDLIRNPAGVDDLEEEDEHGGDIIDEPHDAFGEDDEDGYDAEHDY